MIFQQRLKGARPAALIGGGLITALLAWFFGPASRLPPPGDDTPEPAPTQPAPHEARPITPSSGPRAPIHAPPAIPAVVIIPGEPFPTNSTGFQAAMAERRDGVRACWEDWRSTHPESSGEIVVRFYIEDDPTSGDAYVDTFELFDEDVIDTRLHGCVLSELEDLRFQPVQGGKIFTYPFRFESVTPK